MPNLIPFVSYVLVTAFTPGPNNVMSMLNAGRVGFRKGIKFNLGIFIGFVVVMILCAAFSTVLMAYLPAIKPVMKYIGAAYILWLAYKTYKSHYEVNDSKTGSAFGIKEGFSLQFVNVKVILYGITTLSTFILPVFSNRLVILSFAIGLAIIGSISNCSWALFGSLFHNLLSKQAKLVNTVMALVLVYTAVSILM
jgi:threonine/homoserine/homoserine lactone efflux protein